jgi:hypothetical protein
VAATPVPAAANPAPVTVRKSRLDTVVELFLPGSCCAIFDSPLIKPRVLQPERRSISIGRGIAQLTQWDFNRAQIFKRIFNSKNEVFVVGAFKVLTAGFRSGG